MKMTKAEVERMDQDTLQSLFEKLKEQIELKRKEEDSYFGRHESVHKANKKEIEEVGRVLDNLNDNFYLVRDRLNEFKKAE